MPFCTNCGKRNPDDARFCSQCGTRLVTEDDGTRTLSFSPEKASEKTGEVDTGLNPADSAAVDALPEGHALLIVQRGPGAGSRFLLDADLITAGRHPDSDIFLDDVTVSRRHAEFRRTADREFTVSDVGSLNGTYVNRDRIDEVTLQDADEVQIGKFRLVYFASHNNPQASGQSAQGPTG